MVVLGTQGFEQCNGVRERLHALHQSVYHVDGGLAAAVHSCDIGSPRHEMFDPRGVTAGCCVVGHRIPGRPRLRQCPAHPRGGSRRAACRSMRVPDKSLAVTGTGRGEQRRATGAADGHLREPGVVFCVVGTACATLSWAFPTGRLSGWGRGVSPAGHQELHRRHVTGMHRPPEWCRALRISSRQCETESSGRHCKQHGRDHVPDRMSSHVPPADEPMCHST